VRRRGAENGASNSLPSGVSHIILNGTVIMEETLRVAVEEVAWMFLIIGLCFDCNFTARAFTV
jgi:hypothetical protein